MGELRSVLVRRDSAGGEEEVSACRSGEKRRFLRENLHFIEGIFRRSFTSGTVFILFLKSKHDIFAVFSSFS